jgi:hypothetical protein
MLKEKKIGLLLAEEASVTLWEEVHAGRKPPRLPVAVS